MSILILQHLFILSISHPHFRCLIWLPCLNMHVQNQCCSPSFQANSACKPYLRGRARNGGLLIASLTHMILLTHSHRSSQFWCIFFNTPISHVTTTSFQASMISCLNYSSNLLLEWHFQNANDVKPLTTSSLHSQWISDNETGSLLPWRRFIKICYGLYLGVPKRPQVFRNRTLERWLDHGNTALLSGSIHWGISSELNVLLGSGPGWRRVTEGVRWDGLPPPRLLPAFSLLPGPHAWAGFLHSTCFHYAASALEEPDCELSALKPLNPNKLLLWECQIYLTDEKVTKTS